MDSILKAVDQLACYGLQITTIDAVGKLIRVAVDGDKGKKKSGWYVAHEFYLKNGDCIIVGRFGNWKLSDETQKFEVDFSFSDEDRAAYKKKMAADRQRVEKEQKRARADAVKRSAVLAKSLTSSSSVERTTVYLVNKKVAGHNVYYGKGGTLFVPVSQHKRGLVGFQIISPEGDKKFLTGTEKRGAYHWIGAHVKSDVLLLAEGYATAASLFEATKYPCFVAFDAGNLSLVANMLRQRWPDKQIVVCADDDHATDDNPGVSKATIAAKAINAALAIPYFTDNTNKTDFNDMAIEQGFDTVAACIEKQLAIFSADNSLACIDNEVIDPSCDFSINQVLSDFVILHGCGGGVFDDKRCEFMSAGDLRNSLGSAVANEFFNNVDRRVVLRRNVVFDPTSIEQPAGFINLFRGLPLKPIKGDCSLLLDMLFYLCEENEKVFDWVLKWIAYPLQNVGAKMTTAVVIHGKEGAGKNLFWTAIQRIYGEYTSIITQTELESSFNSWASRKLFVIGNEVVSRQEMFHKKGVMRNMITEPEWFINEKNIKERIEPNHANFVFFSNFLQPVAPDKDDRRYLVLWTPPKKDKDYYRKVAYQRDNGGTEALFDYLLRYDLGDFDQYSEPLMTVAKEDLIHLSMKSDERFIENWLFDDLPVPMVPVLTSSLYDAYKYWCKREGEKFYVTSTEFGTFLNKHELVNKIADQRYLNSSRQSKGTFVIPFGCEKPEGESNAKWLGKANDEFCVYYKEWYESE